MSDPELEALRRDFLASLSDRALRIEGVVQAIQDLEQVRVASPEWTEVHFVAHKTAGVAATYGFEGVTDFCGRLDDEMCRLRQAGIQEISRERFQGWLGRLREVLREAAQGRDSVRSKPLE